MARDPVAPIDAIRTGHLAAKGGGLAPLVQRATSHGASLSVMPIRNVLRAPRRTLLTAAGIGAHAVITNVHKRTVIAEGIQEGKATSERKE